MTQKKSKISKGDAATVKALERLEVQGFESLSEIDKVLATLWAVEAEVSNGGFDQFFFNSSGDLAFYAPTALRKIGAFQMAKLAKKANSVFGSDGPPKDSETRRALVQKFSSEVKTQLDQLDSEFYEYPDNIGMLIEDYVALNSI